MAKFEGINKHYESGKEEKKSTKEDRDRMMQEFLAKGGKGERVKPEITKRMLERGKF